MLDLSATAKQDRETYAKDPRRASFFWERHDNGIVTKGEWTIDHQEVRLREIGRPPFTFVAIPYRSEFGEAPTIEVRHGEVPVWGHRVLLTIEPIPNGRQILLEALIFGAGVAIENGPPVKVKAVDAEGNETEVERPSPREIPDPYDPSHMLYDIVGNVMLVLPDGSRHGFRSFKEAQDAFSA